MQTSTHTLMSPLCLLWRSICWPKYLDTNLDFILQLNTHTALKQVTLELTVLDYDMLGGSDAIGKVIFIDDAWRAELVLAFSSYFRWLLERVGRSWRRSTGWRWWTTRGGPSSTGTSWGSPSPATRSRRRTRVRTRQMDKLVSVFCLYFAIFNLFSSKYFDFLVWMKRI